MVRPFTPLERTSTVQCLGRGADDLMIYELARAVGCILVTQNGRDFATLCGGMGRCRSLYCQRRRHAFSMLTYGGSFRAPEGFCILARAFCRDRCPRARDHLPRDARVKLGDPCNTARLMRTEGDDTLTARLFLPSPFRCIFGSLGAFFWGRGLTLAKMRTAAGFPEHVERHEHASPILG